MTLAMNEICPVSIAIIEQKMKFIYYETEFCS